MAVSLRTRARVRAPWQRRGNSPLGDYPLCRQLLCRRKLNTELRLQNFDQRLAEPRRRCRYADASGFHGRDLRFRIALAPRDDGAGVAHAAAGGCGAPGDEADHGFFAPAPGLIGDELGSVLLGRATISPIITMASVAGSASSISSTSMNS